MSQCKIDFLSYERVIRSIPMRWKKLLPKVNIQITNNSKNALEEIENKAKVAAWYYTSQLEKQGMQDNCYLKWGDELQINLNRGEWSEIRIRGMKLTLCTKLRYFQYRVLSRK